MTALDLAELEAAVSVMTPGPWFTVDEPWGDGSVINAGNPDPHGGRLIADFDIIDDLVEGDPDPLDNATGIVALRNAAPELLARLKAAEARVTELELERQGIDDWHRAMLVEIAELRQRMKDRHGPTEADIAKCDQLVREWQAKRVVAKEPTP